MDIKRHFSKTRYAPTPSGYLHLGNILSFAITAALAQQAGARILLRIDDFDRERTNPRFVNDIFDTLHFLQLPWHDGPKDYTEYESTYSQVHRTALYNSALQQLRDGGHLFACTCTRTQVVLPGGDGVYPGTCRHKGIPLDTPGTSWRLHTATATDITVNTLDGAVTQQLPPNMHNCIVRKKDGYAAYQLISVIDDLFLGTDLVVRGDDLWPSTLAQCYLASLLGHRSFSAIAFHHHPLLLEADGKKLSKSEGATSVHYLREAGNSAAAIWGEVAALAGIDRSADSLERQLNELLEIYCQ